MGTKTGRVVVYQPQTLQTLMITVFDKSPILNIFVDEAGISPYFLITDGRVWKSVEYLTSAV